MATPSSIPLPLTGDNVIDAATNGFYWQLDSSRTINWSLANGFLGEFWTSPSDVAATLSSVFNNISSYANVRFNYVGYYTDPSTAYFAGSDITISVDGSFLLFGNTSTWALGFFPDSSYNTSIYQGAPGDAFLNLNSLANFLPSYAPGSAGYALAIHEIGHALGLKHPFDDGGTGSPTLQELGVPELDIDWFTVMAYNDDYNYGLRFWDPATPMVMDVLALQFLYGKNTTTNATNTSHTLGLNGMYQTIWDAGGIDTVNVSGSSAGWEIDLPIFQPSALVDTKVGLALPISETSLSSPLTLYWLTGDIENATGSAFADNLIGNDFSNSLVGNLGNDLLVGGAGDDILNGGGGTDNLEGDAGNDIFLLGATGDFAAGELIDGGVADTDTLRYTGNIAATLILTGGVTNIEQVQIANAAGSTVGSAAINVNAAALVTGITLSGNDGNNVLTGTAQADTINGNGGNDTVTGGAGDDTLNGGNGNDVFVIGNAADHGVGEVINGDAGADVIRFTSVTGGEELTLSAGVTVESVVFGTAAGATTGITALSVNATDVGNGLAITGNAGANTLIGTEFDDVLVGNAGNDTLNGLGGNDTL
ncbi:MAG: hypothetical protein ACRD88_00490, partial [Terriglobia bacterium]